MPRHKANVTDFYAKRNEQTKKRWRISGIVYTVHACLLFTCILFAGIHQHDAARIGWALIAMGIVSIPTAIFHIYTIDNAWEPKMRSQLHQELYRSNARDYQYGTEHSTRDVTDAEMAIVAIVYILLSIVPLILGILKLCEIF